MNLFIRKLDAIHIYLNNKIANRCPLLSLYLFTKPRNRFLHFKKERQAEKGRAQIKSNKKSIILFSTHRSASLFVARTIGKLAKGEQIVKIDYDDYFSKTDNKKYELFGNKEFLKRAFCNKGFFYGAFRSFRHIPDLDQYRIILVLRDPRDVLTSQHFSLSFSHAVINKKLYDGRKKALTQSIDENVLERANRLKDVYEDYCKYALDLPNVLFLKYEEMIVDFEGWLMKLIEHLELTPDTNLIREIIDSTNFSVEKEDIYSHRRQVKSGDHKNKLKPETIKKLNEMFKDVMNKLDYKI